MDYKSAIKECVAEIAAQLIGLKAQMASAESCTGGLIATSCTALSGASEWFDTGVVTYTRQSKKGVLGLLERDIRDGLVTESTAISMCEHVAEISRSDFAVSTTGVAGPSESEGYKPCAAWIAAHTPMGTVSRWIEHEDEGREANRAHIALEALTLLSEEIEKYIERRR